MKHKTHKRSILKLAVSVLLLFGTLLCSVMHPTPAKAAPYEIDVPVIYQFNYPDVLFYYGGIGRTVADAGCGPTCVSMVIRYYRSDVSQTPEDLFLWLYENNRYFGKGSDLDGLAALCSLYGIETEVIEAEDDNQAKRIATALKDGKPVIANMGPGTFTSSGHYILLTGYKVENGVEKVRVNDPNSSSRTGTYYELSTVINESMRYHWGIDSFLICSYGKPATPSTLKATVSLDTTTVTEGNSCNIYGTISSNYTITSVVGSIVDLATNQTIQYEKVTPNATSVSLYSTNINKNLTFGTLKPGNYQLVISASDRSLTSKVATINFTIKAKASTLKVSPSLESYSIRYGSPCNITGSITSNQPLKRIEGYIINSAGRTVDSCIAYPTGNSVYLKYSALNTYLTFGTLPRGTYRLKVTAVDTTTSKTAYCYFTIR